MSFDVLNDISPEVREELGRILEIDPELLNPIPPKGRELEWYNASDAREEARFICEHVEARLKHGRVNKD